MKIDCIEQLSRSDAFREDLGRLLLEICREDTSIRPDVDALRAAEHRVFAALEREVSSYGLNCRAMRLPIRPDIEQHRFFSQLYYTNTPERPAGLPLAEAYRDRHNLVFHIAGDARHPRGVRQALNAHIDVVRPFIPPRLDGRTLFGRGACDDKGPVIAIVGALKLLAQLQRETGTRLNQDLTAMVVIEEEMGGNGSLSLAIDRDLRRQYDSLLVLECCSNRIYPGNRGALWYKLAIRRSDARLNLIEASAFIVEQLELEGRATKAESRHELFPHRPAQTCHGIIGPFGEHPSRICGRADFLIRMPHGSAQETLLRDLLDDAVALYTGTYGDKTQVTGADGKPKVDHHFDLLAAPGGYMVQVHGSAGHMGSILENDGAITKLATMVRAILRSRARLSAIAGAAPVLELANHADPETLIMEGGQGFLPTHEMEEVMQRLTTAARRGYTDYARRIGMHTDVATDVTVTFDKLHNAAFAGDPNSRDAANAIAAAKDAGTWQEGPIRGWDVSCDARLFACEYPDLPVLTSGPGALTFAHADTEQIDLDEIAHSARFLAYFILQQTGTLET